MDKVKIGKKEYAFHLGRSTLRMFARNKGCEKKSVNEMMEGASLYDQDLISWCALKVGCSKEDIDFNLSFEDFQKELDDDPILVDTIDELAEKEMPAGEKTEGNVKKVKGKS